MRRPRLLARSPGGTLARGAERPDLAYRAHELPLAITHLEQALRLMPDSVAARSLLLMAIMEAGQWGERSEKLAMDVTQCQPKTAEDFFFKGYALTVLGDLGESLKAMNQAVSLRDSAIARAMRAMALAWDALDRSDPQTAEQAMEDARVARTLMADEAGSLVADLQVQNMAATVFAHTGQDQKRAAALANAERIVTAERTPPSPVFTLMLQCMHYSLLGDDQRALPVLTQLRGADLRSIKAEFMAPWLEYSYAMALYRSGQIDAARELVRKMPVPRPGEIGLFGMVYLVAELPEPEGPAQAYEWYRRVNELHVPTAIALYPQTILRLLGRKAEAVEASRTLKDRTRLWT